VATEILLPQRGMGMSEATIVCWHRNEGDYVKEGEPLVQIESSKATEEIVAPISGVVAEIRCRAGEVVEVGKVLAVIAGADERGGAVSIAAAGTPDGGEEQESRRSSRVQPLSSVRRVIAQRMLASLQSSAQLTLHTQADVTATVERRAVMVAHSGVTYTDILVKVVADAMAKHPIMGAVWDEDSILLPEHVDIGVAMAVDDGLVVPVVRDADQKSLKEVSADMSALLEKARNGQLVAQELSGGVFTITNLGMYCVDAFTPILNPPQTAILGVGRIAKKPSVVNDRIVPRSMIGLSLTFDHRVVDGAPAAAFLNVISSALEEARF